MQQFAEACTKQQLQECRVFFILSSHHPSLNWRCGSQLGVSFFLTFSHSWVLVQPCSKANHLPPWKLV